MKAKYAIAIIATIAAFVGIVAFLFLRFRNILVVTNSFFIVGIFIFIAGAFVACRISHFGVRRPSLDAVYPSNPPFDNSRRNVKTGLLVIAIGVAMMLMSVIIWEFTQHGIF